MSNYLKFFVLATLLITCIDSFSQMGITAYSTDALAINTSQSKKISGEFKMFANKDLEGVMTEIDIFYNFKAKPYHRFSIGLGLNAIPFQNAPDPLNAFTIPAAIEIYPLQDFKRLSLLFELTTELTRETYIRTLWGIRYSFND